MPRSEFEKAMPAWRLARARFSRSCGFRSRRRAEAARQQGQGAQGVDIGEGRGGERKIGFDRMTEGIDRRRSDMLIREGAESVRVGEADIRGDTAAHDGEFALFLAIIDNHELGDIRAGATGRRAEDQGGKGAVNQVGPGVFPNLPAVGDEDGDPLGGIHGAAAAEADDHIRPLGDIFAGAGFDFVILGIGGHLVKIDKGQAGREQALHHLVDPAGREEPLIADQKDLLATEPAGTDAGLVEEAPTEDDLGDFKFTVMMLFPTH